MLIFKGSTHMHHKQNPRAYIPHIKQSCVILDHTWKVEQKHLRARDIDCDLASEILNIYISPDSFLIENIPEKKKIQALAFLKETTITCVKPA